MEVNNKKNIYRSIKDNALSTSDLVGGLDNHLDSGYFLVEINNSDRLELGLPVEACSHEHYAKAHLLVTESGTDEQLQRNRLIGQTLIMPDCNEGCTRIFTRIRKKVNGDYVWSDWCILAQSSMDDEINNAEDLVAKVTELMSETRKVKTDFSSEKVRTKEAEAAIMKDAMLNGSLNINPGPHCVILDYHNIDGTEVREVDIPAATTEKAGVMSAEDKERVDGNINSASYVIADASGNIILKIDKNGIKTTDVTISQGKLSDLLNAITDAIETVKIDTRAEVETLKETTEQNINELTDKIDSEIENDSFFITDAIGNIIFKVDAGGVHSINVGNPTPTWIIIQVLSEAYIPSNIERDSVGDVVSCNALFIDGVEGSIVFTRENGEVSHIAAIHGSVNAEAKIIRNNGNVEQINIL